MSVTTRPSAQTVTEAGYFRWLQLAMGIVCMAMIANLQYGWTLFVDPIDAKFHWGRAAIQLAFTLFVVTETWLVPIEAWFVDKYGPSVVIMFGGVMIALAWVLNSNASSLVVLYVAAVIAGIGAGSGVLTPTATTFGVVHVTATAGTLTATVPVTVKLATLSVQRASQNCARQLLV